MTSLGSLEPPATVLEKPESTGFTDKNTETQSEFDFKQLEHKIMIKQQHAYMLVKIQVKVHL